MNRSQQGISLLSVTVVLLLTLLLVLGTFRTLMFHEIQQGNNSDYQRTFAAAEAMLRDAEIDIRGRLPPYNAASPSGQPCRTRDGNRVFVGCREQTGTKPWFPRDNAEFDAVYDIVRAASQSNTSTSTGPCLEGICFPDSLSPAADLAQQFDAMRPLGACYGQFTQAKQPPPRLPDQEGNPVLQARYDSLRQCRQAQAWYWIEAFRYAEGASSGPAPDAALQPDPSMRVVYRITALAQGLKTGTQVVLQSYFVPYPASQNP